MAHADFFQAIHPLWYELADGGAVRALPGADDARVLDAAHAHGVLVIPLVAAVHDVALLRAVLRDPARRTAHIRALVALAVDHGYPGLDLDYEHLWGRDDRATVQAFVAELAPAMHAAGKTLSAAVPAQTASTSGTAWDYGFLAARLDRVHIMAYDFHVVGGHAGPIAPQGWIDAVVAHAAATGHPAAFLLGLPNYGVTPTWSGTTRRSAALCSWYAVVDDHMPHCPRGRWLAGRAPHCETSKGLLYFEDLRSLAAKAAAARAAGLGGITYWHLGGEPEGFFEMLEGHYPDPP